MRKIVCFLSAIFLLVSCVPEGKDYEYIGNLFVVIVAAAGLIGVIKGCWEGLFAIVNFKKEKRRKRQEQFNLIASQLTSENKSSKLSAAVLIRRFFDEEYGKSLKKEALSLISSLSRVLPTGIFQKTLVDGLAYASDLSNFDLQKTNLQDSYLGVKKGNLIMNHTDLFLADLSYALIQNVIGHNIIFYRSVLLATRIKDCDFTNANFRGADLTNVSFRNVILKGADFNDAYNIPTGIKEKLIDGIFADESPISATEKSQKTIFFSMPGILNKEDDVLTNDYKRILESRGYEVLFYHRDLYPSYGQFNRVKESIQRSVGMIAFGLKQIQIEKGTYRPGTPESEDWTNKWLSTPWSEIEIGMGLMKGLPILIVCDPAINIGAFDSCLSECYVSQISTKTDSKTIEQNKSFDEWLAKL